MKILSLSHILSLLLLIQPLDVIVCKILSVLNIMMTVDSLILAQGHSPFHLSALQATILKFSDLSLCRQEFMSSLKIMQ